MQLLIEFIVEVSNMTLRTIGFFNTFLMLVLIAFWGSSFVVVKIALREGLTPVALATFRFLIAGALFLIILIYRKVRKHDSIPSQSIDKKDLPLFVLLALSGVTFFFAAQYTGIKMAGAAIAAIFVCLLSPILIAIFSAVVFKEQLRKRHIAGIGTAVIGTSIVIAGGSLSFYGDSEFLVGSLLLLFTPFLWTLYTLLGKKIVGKYEPSLAVTYITLLGGLCLVPMSIAENSFQQILFLSINGWLAILFLSLTCSMLGYYIWFYVLKRVGATITSSFLFAEPLVTAVFAVVLVGEVMTWMTIAGGFLIFFGVALVAKNN